MSEVYVSSFDDNGITKYGLFVSGDDNPEPYKVDWKHVVYDTRDEADSKLKSIEAEKAREDTAVPFSLEVIFLYYH